MFSYLYEVRLLNKKNYGIFLFKNRKNGSLRKKKKIAFLFLIDDRRIFKEVGQILFLVNY